MLQFLNKFHDFNLKPKFLFNITEITSSVIQSSPIRPQLPSEQSRNNCPISPYFPSASDRRDSRVSSEGTFTPSRGTRKVEVSGTHSGMGKGTRNIALMAMWSDEEVRSAPGATRSAYSEGIDLRLYVLFCCCCCFTILESESCASCGSGDS